jgi:hypothetical protein
MIRWASERDYPSCSDMLVTEGIPEEQHRYEQWPSWVYEDEKGIAGLITINIVNGRPSLQHLCIQRSRRHGGIRIVRDLLRWFKQKCAESGNSHAYAHADKDKPHIKRAIEYYFKVKPYYDSEKRYWYFLTIRGNA